MKNIFVVEDETLVRLGIHTIVKEYAKQYAIIGETDNGTIATEQILLLQPDIVLMDITIPGANGIEVLRLIRAQGYNGYVMMLTCHDEIQFAQQALRYGADDYVLKTELSSGSLLSYLEKAEQSDRITDGKQTAQWIGDKQENFLCNLFMSGLEDGSEFDRACADYGLPLSHRGLYFLVVHICDYTEVLKRYEREEQDMLFTAIGILIKESLGYLKQYEIVRFSPENHLVLLTLEREPSEQKIHETLAACAQRINHSIETFLNMNVLIGISSKIHEVGRINLDFERVLRMLDRAYFFPEETVQWDARQWEKDRTIALLEELKKSLREMLDGSCPMDPGGAVRLFISCCAPKSILPDKANFLYTVQDFSGNVHAKLGMDWSPFAATVTVPQILCHLDEVQTLCTQSEKPQNYLAAQAMAYIDLHFTEEITLESIARQIGVSASYLSRVFGKAVGQNISLYITEKRVERAKYLIGSTMLKHYEIAEKCGLNSSAYFTSVFKKTTGMTPNQYRNTVE